MCYNKRTWLFTLLISHLSTEDSKGSIVSTGRLIIIIDIRLRTVVLQILN